MAIRLKLGETIYLDVVPVDGNTNIIPIKAGTLKLNTNPQGIIAPAMDEPDKSYTIKGLRLGYTVITVKATTLSGALYETRELIDVLPALPDPTSTQLSITKKEVL